MGFYRLKHGFTAGELSPLMEDRVDFDRYKNGCKKLYNAVCAVQGPAVRRPGFKFVYDLVSIGMDVTDPELRNIPFIFNENQAYAMVLYRHTDLSGRIVFGTTNTSGEEGLVVGTGDVCTYDQVNTETYVTTELVYTFPYAAGATITALEVIYTDQADPPVDTVLADPADYSFTQAAGVATVTLTGARATDGTLTFNSTIDSAAIAVGEIVTLELPADWDIEGFDWAQSGDEMYVAQSGLPPHIIKRHAPDCWELVEVAFTDQPDDWSDDYGWPERVTFHQQRLVFAANLLRRQTVWMTEAGDFSSFSISSPLVDSDAVTFTLDSGTQNKIQWITSGKSLHAGTLGNEWTVSGNDRSALTPSNILAQRQTSNGSEPLKPILVGLTTMFLEQHGRVVNEFVYDYTFDSYKTSDVAILSKHITEHYSIVDWTYQQTPDSIIWCVRADGLIAGITYQRQHKVVGWHVHETDGGFMTITCIPGNTREDDVWTTVHRVIDGADKYYVEKMDDWFKSEEASEGRFLDSYLVYDGVPADTISGLEHLEGETVDVLADGTVHPPVVVASGEIELDAEHSVVVVGLGYISEIRPNLTDIPADTGAGTSLGREQRITELNVDFYKSLGCEFGRYDQEDGEVSEEVVFRVPGDLTGQQVPLFTGWKKIPFMEGFDRRSEYFLRQTQPLPMTIRSIVDKVEVQE